MKKKMALLLMAAMMMGSLCACGSGADGGETAESAGKTDGDAAPDAGEEFMEAMHPTDITVEDYVTLGDYKKMEVTVAPASVAQETIDGYITTQLANASDPAAGVTDRAVAAGDMVDIDYEGKMDGVAFAGGTASGAKLTLGSHQFIDGFESGLVEKKVKPGETVDLDLTFPDPCANNPDLAGKPVVFTVKVNFIVAGLEDFDDAKAAVLNPDCATVEEYRAYAQEVLMEDAQQQYQMELESAIRKKVVEEAQFLQEIPEGMGADYYNQNLEWVSMMASYYYGMDLDTYARVIGYKGADEIKQELRTEAEFYAKWVVCAQAIANREGLTVSDEEVEAQLQSMAERNGYESVEALKEEGVDAESQRTFMMYAAVSEYLKDNITVNAE